jgi:hypothetical protein
MTDFNDDPWGSTDEDGETGYVGITETTATAGAAREWLLGPGAEDVLGIYDARYRRAVPDALTLRHLTVKLPPSAELPEAARVGDLLRAGVASGWWDFDISGATEELPGPDGGWREEFARIDAERTVEAQRRAEEDQGPWWWRLRCWAADRLATAGSAVDPEDRSSVYWIENDCYCSARVRGYGERS